MRLSTILACGLDGGLGYKGRLLWNLRDDMARFKKLTTEGGVVIVGRKTLESLPDYKPLPGRVNIMLSRSGVVRRGFLMATSVGDALKKASGQRAKEVFVIGGGAIYRSFMPWVETVYLTLVRSEKPSDARFPLGALFGRDWRLEKRVDADRREGEPPYAFLVFSRYVTSPALSKENSKLPTLIKLKLDKTEPDFEVVKAMPGLEGLLLDECFGLLGLGEDLSLYVVKADRFDDPERRARLSPEILQAYGNDPISTTGGEG